MGYYSEVAIKCEKNAYERFKEIFTEYFSPDEVYKDNEDYILHWNYVKWYDNFDEIRAVVDVMDELDVEYDEAEVNSIGYSFIRLGEDICDVETRLNDYDFELYVSRAIDLPLHLEEIDVWRDII